MWITFKDTNQVEVDGQKRTQCANNNHQDLEWL